MPENHTVRIGQIYEPCDPRERSSLRVCWYEPGQIRAQVTDTTGKRPRWLLVKALHASATTKHGKPRRSGYRLIQEAPDA